jgi:hypothetical protein
MSEEDVMGLRETLEAATRECAPGDLQCVFMRDWANEVLADRNHEIVALVLDMGEELRHQARFDDEDCGDPDCEDCKGLRQRAALLTRLDQLGKEQT